MIVRNWTNGNSASSSSFENSFLTRYHSESRRFFFSDIHSTYQIMKGLVTLVTGGASGLGLACAKRFSKQGARVIICDLPSSKGDEVVQNWRSTLNAPNASPDEPEKKSTSSSQVGSDALLDLRSSKGSRSFLSIGFVFRHQRLTGKRLVPNQPLRIAPLRLRLRMCLTRSSFLRMWPMNNRYKRCAIRSNRNMDVWTMLSTARGLASLSEATISTK